MNDCRNFDYVHMATRGQSESACHLVSCENDHSDPQNRLCKINWIADATTCPKCQESSEYLYVRVVEASDRHLQECKVCGGRRSLPEKTICEDCSAVIELQV